MKKINLCVDEKISVPNFFCPELFFAEEFFSAAPSSPLRMDLMDEWTWYILAISAINKWSDERLGLTKTVIYCGYGFCE